MITDGRPFNTDVFFSGGAGMFIQYHDIVKPIGLYTIIQMIMTGQTFGLPVDIISHMSILSLTEWYVNRRYKNPLKCLDYARHMDDATLDKLYRDILKDQTIYKYSSALNIEQLLSVYNRQHMSFPVYVYSEYEEPYIKDDCKIIFPGIDVKYVFGNLKECIKKCDQNFTYIFSDIELVKNAAEILVGTCSHILLAEDYRYNYSDFKKTFKTDLKEIATQYPYVRLGTTIAMDMSKVVVDFTRLYQYQEVVT